MVGAVLLVDRDAGVEIAHADHAAAGCDEERHALEVVHEVIDTSWFETTTAARNVPPPPKRGRKLTSTSASSPGSNVRHASPMRVSVLVEAHAVLGEDPELHLRALHGLVEAQAGPVGERSVLVHGADRQRRRRRRARDGATRTAAAPSCSVARPRHELVVARDRALGRPVELDPAVVHADRAAGTAPAPPASQWLTNTSAVPDRLQLAHPVEAAERGTRRRRPRAPRRRAARPARRAWRPRSRAA